VNRIPSAVVKKAQKIKLLLLDVDGVLTDGSIVMDDTGREIKRFDVRDGHGIRLLMSSGVRVGFISGRLSKAVSHRAKELGVRMVYQNAQLKTETYQKIKKRTGLSDQQIAYMGDDIADLPVLRRAGLALTVKDCWKGLKPIVDYITQAKGGRGAVREAIELLMRTQRRWRETVRDYELS
jgi:3-deoxy-D-manno-octulosonate 8-phosphate phosphatase (KDO 8-P phosphatase)